MYVNGLIWPKVEDLPRGAETPFDEDGNPVKGESLWGAPMQACVQQVSESMRARYEDGRYHAATYHINVEIPPRSVFEPEVIKLAQYGRMLGEFTVISCKLLPTVGRIEIIV